MNMNMKNVKAGLLLAGCLMCFAAIAAEVSPKYIFLFIGDGMSMPQRMMAEEFAIKTGYGELVMNRLPYQVSTRTKSADAIITDSAAAATAIASGTKTGNAMLGLKLDGTRLESVAEVAKRNGRKVAILTTTAISHATPAGFYAHRKHRGETYRIGLDLVASGFDYFAGGGFGGKADDKGDSQYRGNLYDLARAAGYTVATNMVDWAALRNGDKALCTLGPTHLSHAIDGDSSRPTLADMLRKGIEVVDNPAGFFIMCEGGTIDFAGHANDAATNLRETLSLNDAVKVALEFADRHPADTLVITTGDHETGGLSMGFAGTGGKFNVERLAGQKTSNERFSTEVKRILMKDVDASFDSFKPLLTAKYGLVFDGDEKNPMRVTSAEEKTLRDALEKDREYTRKHIADTTAHDMGRRYTFATTACNVLAAHAGIGWSSGWHTALPTLTTAKGCRADILIGMTENTDIGQRLKELVQK